MNFKFEGLVKKGTARGREIGFPTINLDVLEGAVPSDFGVYMVALTVGGKKHFGAMHYGLRHVINDLKPSLEIHILDFSGDLYGQKVKVEVLKKIREVKNFTSMEKLRVQIEKDVQEIRKLQQG